MPTFFFFFKGKTTKVKLQKRIYSVTEQLDTGSSEYEQGKPTGSSEYEQGKQNGGQAICADGAAVRKAGGASALRVIKKAMDALSATVSLLRGHSRRKTSRMLLSIPALATFKPANKDLKKIV